MGEKEPAHGNFAIRMTEVIEKRLVTPLAVVMPFLGLALIITRDWDLWRSEWLLISIPLYAASFFFAILVQNRWVAQMIRLTGGHPGAEAPSMPEPGVAPVAGGQTAPPRVPRARQEGQPRRHLPHARGHRDRRADGLEVRRLLHRGGVLRPR